jgi:hypothetical protein
MIARVDRLFLWPGAVPAALWRIQRDRRQKDHHSGLAVGSFQFSPSRTACRSFDQRVHAGPLRSSVDHDGIYGLSIVRNLHHCICSFSACSGSRRGSLRCCLGCFPGKKMNATMAHGFLLLTDCDLDLVYYLRLRSCAHGSSTSSHRLGLYVLGFRYSVIIWRCAGNAQYRRQPGLEVAILYSVGVAGAFVPLGLLCSRIAMERRSTRQDRSCKEQPTETCFRLTGQGSYDRGELGLHQAHNSP